MSLVWENLCVTKSDKKLLNGLYGFAEAGRIMAIMGPSGSGKSTLLDSLAGRLSPGTSMTGNLLLNGKTKTNHSKYISYVTQEDVLLGTLTVREAISYSAKLRLPSTSTTQQIKKLVEDTIIDMGLQHCSDTRIGNWYSRGISTGEKKRVSISIEIVTNPHLMFLDEPTTGLDSASAFFVVQSLRSIARDGKIVITSIHQPNSDLFDLFDDLILLSVGETVYCGNAKSAITFFGEAGFPCPRNRNPSDHFLRCISIDFDAVNEALLRCQNICVSSDPMINMKTTEIRAKLIEKFNSSDKYSSLKRRNMEDTEERVNFSVESMKIQKNDRQSRWKQMKTLSDRSFKNMYREIGYYWFRMIFYILISITIGILFFNMGSEDGELLARVKCVCFIYGFMICLSCGGLPFFIEDLKVFRREKMGGHYGDLVFVLANMVSSLPFLVTISLVSSTIIYYMVRFHPGFSHYSFFCINLFCCISVIEGCMMIVAYLVPNVLMGMGVGTSVVVFMMMASQIFRPLPDLPKFFWRYPMSYLSFATWAIQGQYKNDMIGLEFKPIFPGESKMKGEIILETQLGVPLNHSKWLDLTALFFLMFSQRILFYIVLRFTGTPSSMLRKMFAKKTSVSQESIVSKRHKPLHPLSSQEGAQSPLPEKTSTFHAIYLSS